MEALLAALASFVQPAINYAEQKLESVGAAFAGTMVTAVNQFTNDQRSIATKVTAYWQAQFSAAVAGGANPLDAIQTASTHTLGEFIKEEGQEGTKVVQVVITTLEIAFENSLKKAS